MKQTIYTIGHSNHELDYFHGLLAEQEIKCVVDVRSVPFSSYNSQFNKPELAKYLQDKGLYYLWLGDKIGARYEDPQLLKESGAVDFARVRQTDEFKAGIKRLLQGLKKGFTISLMCSEKEPLDCHRAILISPVLKAKGISVNHILADGDILTHAELEDKLVEMYFGGGRQARLFNRNEDKTDLELAYEKRNEEMG
jgi:uncharacterized protein (DUF488 family)